MKVNYDLYLQQWEIVPVQSMLSPVLESVPVLSSVLQSVPVLSMLSPVLCAGAIVTGKDTYLALTDFT